MEKVGTNSIHNLLLTELEARHSMPSWYPIPNGDMVSLVCNGMRYVLREDFTIEVFDFLTDLQKVHNLFKKSEATASLYECKQQLNLLVIKKIVAS